MWLRINQTNNYETNLTQKKIFKQHTIANTGTSNLFIPKKKKKQLVTLVAGSRLHAN